MSVTENYVCKECSYYKGCAGINPCDCTNAYFIKCSLTAQYDYQMHLKQLNRKVKL